MASDTRAHFLRSAGHLLAARAPATSASLMYQAIQVTSNSLLSKTLEEVCPTCGSVSIRAWNSASRIIIPRSGKQMVSAQRVTTNNSKASKSVTSHVRRLNISCMLCGRFRPQTLSRLRIANASDNTRPALSLPTSATQKSLQSRMRTGMGTPLERASPRSVPLPSDDLNLMDLLK